MEEHGVQIVEQETTGEVPLMVEKYDAKASCKWILVRGRRMGETCDKKCLTDTEYCRDHQKGQASVEAKNEATLEEDEDDDPDDPFSRKYYDDLNALDVDELMHLMNKLDLESFLKRKDIPPLPPRTGEPVTQTKTYSVTETENPEPEPVSVTVQLGKKKVTVTIE